jgi:hypothetical protein
MGREMSILDAIEARGHLAQLAAGRILSEDAWETQYKPLDNPISGDTRFDPEDDDDLEALTELTGGDDRFVWSESEYFEDADGIVFAMEPGKRGDCCGLYATSVPWSNDDADLMVVSHELGY